MSHACGTFQRPKAFCVTQSIKISSVLTISNQKAIFYWRIISARLVSRLVRNLTSPQSFARKDLPCEQLAMLAEPRTRWTRFLVVAEPFQTRPNNWSVTRIRALSRTSGEDGGWEPQIGVCGLNLECRNERGWFQWGIEGDVQSNLKVVSFVDDPS